MATVKINNINTFNNTVLDLKSKIESSLKTNITSINSVFSSIENYRNDGFNANIGDIANTLKSNLESILKNITNAETNLFNYADYINQFNVDDYDAEAKPTNLENLYNEKYLGIVSETNETNQESESKSSDNSGSHSSESSFVVLGDTSSNTDTNNNSSALENYLGNVQGTTIPVNNNLTYNTVSLNITNPNITNPNTLTIVNSQAFNQEGLATFQDRYIISTSKDFGMVGDLIDITHNDGTVLKCIIGNIEENLTTPTINFVVNPDTFKTPLTTIHPNWLNSISEIKNKGNYFNYIK